MKKIIAVFLTFILMIVSGYPVSIAAAFDDIDLHWAHEDILWAKQEGIVEGNAGHFMPDSLITRAQFLTMLVRAFDLETGDNVEFSDVSETDWFYHALCGGLALVPKQMTETGYFLPDAPLKREEMAALTAAAIADSHAASISYADADAISEWAKIGVATVSAKGIMKGDGSLFMPQQNSTRAQAVAVLHRALQSLKTGREAYPSEHIATDIRNVETEMLPIPSTEELATRFPIQQQMRPLADYGPISGVGMVAYFGEGGPGEVYVKRESHVQHNSKTTRFKQFCTLRVIDPDGEVLGYYDFSEKDLEKEEVIIKVPEGKAGIYQISYRNGQNNVDDITIGIPQSEAWAIRGEPSLQFTEKTDKEWYLYIPRTSKEVRVYLRGSQRNQVEIYNEDGNAFTKDLNAALHHYIIPVAKTEVVWRVAFGGTADAGITFMTGVPQLLCKTEEMALFLKGGTQEAQGLLVSGGLQAQAREIAYSMKDNNFDVNLNFAEKIPEDVTEYDVEALMFGVYSGLGNLQNALKTQCLDPSHPYYGGCDSDGYKIKEYDTWEDFAPARRWSLTDAASIAALAGIPTKLNAAYGNQALIDRAVLNAFCCIASLDTTQLIREVNPSSTQFCPSQHAFFIYPSLACCYNLLKHKLDSETRQVFRRALVLIGDGLANNISGQSNQWNENIMGHLETYIATGEKRFLEYYERQIDAISNDEINKNGVGGSYGQHPAGYFMELHGPEGSYQELSMHKFVGGFLYYKNLPEAKPELVTKLYNALEKAVLFESLFWLPQPNGTLLSPNSMNTRTNVMLSNQGYPGFAMAATVSPLAAAMMEILPISSKNLHSASTMPQGALNKPEAARRLIEEGLAGKDERWPERNYFMGYFIPMVYNAYRQPQRAEATATAPIYATNQIWDLDGLLSFKKGKLYGMSFYSNRARATSKNVAASSPLPLVVWTEKLGSVILSCNNTNIDKAETEQLGYSGIIVQKADGSYCKTVNENSTLRWIREGSEYEMVCPIDGIDGTITIHGVIAANCWKLSVYVSSMEEVKNAYVNLPINVIEKGAVITEPENGSFTFSLNGETLHIDYTKGMDAYFDEFVIDSGSTPKVRSLRIELPLFNRPLNLNIYVD